MKIKFKMKNNTVCELINNQYLFDYIKVQTILNKLRIKLIN